MTIFRNPYNNVGAYPPQPFGSVVDKPTLIETSGLNTYNFLRLVNIFGHVAPNHAELVQPAELANELLCGPLNTRK
jgi:hypothetical protein